MASHSPAEVQDGLRRSGTRWLVLGVVLAIVLVLVCALGGRRALGGILRGWLVGWLAWLVVSWGSLGHTMLHHVVRGYWGKPLIRELEAGSGSRSMLVLAVGFLPIAFGASYIYPWTEAGRNTWYLNMPFFIIRAISYLIIWWLFASSLRRSSLSTDPDQAAQEDWRSKVSAPGMAVFFLLASFACFDWMMSLEPDWTSSIYGLVFVIVCALAGFSHAIVYLNARSGDEPYRKLIGPGLTRDLGNLMLTMLLLWAYFNYSQYIIMWSGDITREIRYFTIRNGGWDAAAEILIILGFFGPFLALIIPIVKGSIRLLGGLCAWMLFICWLDLLWMTGAPLVRQGAVDFFAWGVVLSFLCVGGFFRWALLTTLAQAPLVPVQDPQVRRVLDHVAT